MKSLHAFHEGPSSPPMHVPIVEGKPLDLWALYHSVITLGGFEAVKQLHAINIRIDFYSMHFSGEQGRFVEECGSSPRLC